MNAEAIRSLLKAEPFQPFEIRMKNGDVYVVKQPEAVWLAGNRLFIYSVKLDQVNHLSVLNVKGTRRLKEIG